MIVRGLRERLLMAVAGTALWACGEPELTGQPRGEYVAFYFENYERELCAGSVARLDRYIERVFAFFGASPDTFVVPVHVVESSLCSSNACFVTSLREVQMEELDQGSRRVNGVLRHEVTHAVIDRIWGGSAPFFAEGLAESLSQSNAERAPPIGPVGDMLDREARDLDYAAAARFTRFLIDTWGLNRFKQLYQRATVRTQEAIRDLMKEVYGESFEAIEAKYLAGAPRCQYHLDLCDPLGVEPVGLRWSVTQPVSCLDPDVYGSDGDDAPMLATQRTLEIEHGGVYRLRASAGSHHDSQFSLVRCGGCDEQFVLMFRFADFELELDPGLYTLEFLSVSDEVMAVDLEYLGAVQGP